jgi:hypothetical protein
MQEQRPRRLLLGLATPEQVTWFMVAWLGLQTAVEYVLAQVLEANLPIMLVINILEAASIIYFFQHVYRLWREDE